MRKVNKTQLLSRGLIGVIVVLFATPFQVVWGKTLAPVVAVKECPKGKTFSQVLEGVGFSRHDANELPLSTLLPLKMHLNPHERFLVVTDKSKNRTEAHFYLDYQDEALIFWHEGNHSGVNRVPVDFTVRKRSVEGKVRGSLIESIKKLVSDEWAAFRFSDAFSWDLNLGKQLKQNDGYKFVIEEKYDQGKFVKYGEIIKAELQTRGVTLKRLLWQNAKTKVFVDPDTRFEDRPFYAPVDYIHISSPFARRRFHPVRHNYQPHLGVDFALPEGSPIYAAKAGIIESISRHRGNGNYVQIRHENDYVTTYNHMAKYADGLVVGKKVEAGDVIGYVGCSGYCTSPHLDFRIRKGNYLYDPIYITKPYPYKERNYWDTAKFKQLLGITTSQNDIF